MLKKYRTPAIYQYRYNFSLLAFYFTAFFALTLFNGCSNPKPQLGSLSSKSTILAFGDSLTFGTGAAKQNSYPEILQRLINIKIINAGVPGEISSKGKRRLGPLLQQHKPSLVILCHGGNDLIRKMDKQQLRENLNAMIKMIQDQGIAVILLAVPKPGIFLQPADLYKEIAEEFSIPIEEDSLSEIISKPGFKSDPIHPNDRGYRMLAQNIAELLLQSGAIASYAQE